MSDDMLFPEHEPIVVCPSCAQEWRVDQAADDGPSHPVCCPDCGDVLIGSITNNELLPDEIEMLSLYRRLSDEKQIEYKHALRAMLSAPA